MSAGRTLRLIGADPLHSPDPAARRLAARALNGRAARRLLRRAKKWPPESPGALNAWLLLITTKPPKWREPLLHWPQGPPTLGVPHEGFFYPDPLGFWAEVRRWIVTLVRAAEPGVGPADALAVSALLHVGDDPDRVMWGLDLLRPAVLLFLDEAAATGFDLGGDRRPVAIPDPHREGVVYEGWWSRATSGLVVGKSPQHPAAHGLYRPGDMDKFLGAIPID